jgi:hypothetical protein
MGMYTELIFGADLKTDTPENVIEALKFMIGDTEEKPKDFPLPESGCEWLFRGSSYYFGVTAPVSKMWKDHISKNWVLSTRSNVKNYEDEIESFLEWIKPYIDSGSGVRDMYAIVTYEDAKEPTIYYLHDD